MTMAKILWALDGKHFTVLKKGSINKLWDFFNGQEIREHVNLIKGARLRLIGDTGLTIGELPRKK